MKRRFFQKKANFITNIAVMSLATSVFLYFMISSIVDTAWEWVCVYGCAMAISICVIVAKLGNHITLDNEKIYTRGELITFTSRMQHKTKVKYVEIQYLEIACEDCDSNGKQKNMGSKTYLKIFTSHGVKRICLEGFSKMQRQEIMEIIGDRTGNCKIDELLLMR